MFVKKKYVGTLITHVFPLNKINEAMETFIKRIEGAIKVIIRP